MVLLPLPLFDNAITAHYNAQDIVGYRLSSLSIFALVDWHGCMHRFRSYCSCVALRSIHRFILLVPVVYRATAQ
jgi:hypothetical protein